MVNTPIGQASKPPRQWTTKPRRSEAKKTLARRGVNARNLWAVLLRGEMMERSIGDPLECWGFNSFFFEMKQVQKLGEPLDTRTRIGAALLEWGKVFKLLTPDFLVPPPEIRPRWLPLRCLIAVWSFLCYSSKLVWGNIYRKTLSSIGKSIVSGRFSLKPIHCHSDFGGCRLWRLFGSSFKEFHHIPKLKPPCAEGNFDPTGDPTPNGHFSIFPKREGFIKWWFNTF